METSFRREISQQSRCVDVGLRRTVPSVMVLTESADSKRRIERRKSNLLGSKTLVSKTLGSRAFRDQKKGRQNWRPLFLSIGDSLWLEGRVVGGGSHAQLFESIEACQDIVAGDFSPLLAFVT